MRRQVVRVLVLFWLGWYLSGPVCESVDYWDSPSQEAQDILFHAGGGITLVAALSWFAIVLLRKWQEKFLHACGVARELLVPETPAGAMCIAFAPRYAAHSPPLPLRV